MRFLPTAMPALGPTGCIYDPDHYPPVPRPTSNSGISLPGKTDKIPDTPYEVRKGEIERDKQIAGQAGPTYPKLFKSQKSEDNKDGGT